MTVIGVSGWMFLLVPAHLGCPGQNPESCKMVVCMCVCTDSDFINCLISNGKGNCTFTRAFCRGFPLILYAFCMHFVLMPIVWLYLAGITFTWSFGSTAFCCAIVSQTQAKPDYGQTEPVLSSCSAACCLLVCFRIVHYISIFAHI